MFLAKALPPSVRESYNKDAWSGILATTMAGFTGPFIMVIARDRLHAGAALIGLMTAAPYVGNLFSIFWAGAMEGKRKLPFVVWSGFVTRAIFCACVFARTPAVFGAVVIASSIFSTIAGPAYAAVMREIYPKRIRGRAMGYVRVCTTLTTIAAVFIAGPLLEHVSFRIVFPIAAFVGLGASFVFRTLKTAEPDPSEKQPAPEFLLNTLRILKDDKPFRWFSAAVFTAGFGNLLVVPLFPIFQVDVLHITTSQVSVLANTSAIMTTMAYFYWGPYVDRRTPLRGAAIGVFMFSIMPLTYALVASFPNLVPSTNRWLLLLPAMGIVGIASAALDLSYFNSLLRFSPPERVSHYQAVHMSLLGIRGVTAPLIGTALVQRNLVEMQTLFFTAAGMCLLSVALQVYGARTHSVR